MNTPITSKVSYAIGAIALGASLAMGFGSAQAADPELSPTPAVQLSCSIRSKIISLGHDRWMVRARLYRDGKRYPRHALSLWIIADDGSATVSDAPARGEKKAKWNWRMTGAAVAGQTFQAFYVGDTDTLPCEGEILTPIARKSHPASDHGKGSAHAQ
jgi:hypothetical protein